MTFVRRNFRAGFICGLALLVDALTARAQVLHTAAEVQALSTEQARQHHDVRLTGVITFAWHCGTTELTVEDETGAVWLPPVQMPADCVVGTKVEIEGHTEAGVFGPIVQAEVIHVIGPGIMPPAQPSSYEGLFSPHLQFRRVELTGIVRVQRVNPEFGLGWLALEIATGSGRVTVNVTDEITGHPELLDARVRVRGVNLENFDAQQQAFLPMINAHTLDDVQILSPADPQPFAKPTVALNEVMRSADAGGVGHRVHVQGVVTFARRNGSFFLQDQTRGLEVFLREAPVPTAGEIADVVGFPELGVYSPVLRDADWRPAGQKEFPSLAVTTTEAMKHDGQLISVKALLTAIMAGDNEAVLTLADQQLSFRAYVPNASIRFWRVGSELELTGVCSVIVDDWESLITHRQPQSFSLLVRGPEGIRVMQAAPFWTAARVVWVLAAFGITLGVACGWVWVQMRRRLREAARGREAARMQFETVINERTRMAREIHDTMAQGFAGVSVQLEALNGYLGDLPITMRRHFDLARQLVRSSLEEARRGVWNLRAQALEEHGLAGALERFSRQLTEGSGLAFSFHVEGAPRTLPAEVENNLLRIGQEALTNAVRHSGAHQLTLNLVFCADEVCLTVSDDGRGFDPSVTKPSPRGGFGVSGLRERAGEMHAQLEIHSAPGGGTHIKLTVPHV